MKSEYVVFYLFTLSIGCTLGMVLMTELPDGRRSLPKCCPEGDVIGNDGISCVRDPSGDNATTVPANGNTSEYRLVYDPRYSCPRHEALLLPDLEVTLAGDVVVFDDLGHEWALPPAQICLDSLLLPTGTRAYFVFVCPSCQQVDCLHKCCQSSERLKVSEDGLQVNCVPSSGPSWNTLYTSDTSKRVFVFHGFPSCELGMYLGQLPGSVRLDPHGDLLLGLEGPVLDPHGYLLMDQKVPVSRLEYCGDLVDSGPPGHFTFMACRQPLSASDIIKARLYGTFGCIGAAFLALTLALHLWLPELRTSLHSRILLAHIFCSLVALLGLAWADLGSMPAPSPVCSATAFSIQFSFLAAIFWLNVMCVDIAWTFSGVRAPRASLTLDSDGHKYVYYSLYAWGSTAVISGLTALLEYSSILPPGSKFKPSFGVQSCWFRERESTFLLLYGPMGVLLLVNLVLFVYTAIKIRQTQRDTATIVQHAGSKLRDDRNRFSLYVKLFCLMGVTWLFEIVSWWIGGSDKYWYFMDIINALRGAFIFALFCLKKKVINLIKAKFKKVPQFPRYPRKSTSSKTSSISSQRTSSFQLSHIS